MIKRYNWEYRTGFYKHDWHQYLFEMTEEEAKEAFSNKRKHKEYRKTNENNTLLDVTMSVIFAAFFIMLKFSIVY